MSLFNEAQWKALAIVPKITAFPSIVSATFIAQHILRHPKRRSRVYHRLMLGMSLMDVICATKSFVSTWPVPEEALYVVGNVGTMETCAAAGFLGQGSCLSSSVYNATLTLYFLLTIRFGWKEERTKKKLEWFLHLLPLTLGWSTAIAALLLDLMNPIGWTCWIGSWPPGCNDDTIPCERGGDADYIARFRWGFFHGPLWIAFLFMAVSLLSIYLKTRQTEQRTRKYQFDRQSVNYSVHATMAATPESPTSSRNSVAKQQQHPSSSKMKTSSSVEGRNSKSPSLQPEDQGGESSSVALSSSAHEISGSVTSVTPSRGGTDTDKRSRNSSSGNSNNIEARSFREILQDRREQRKDRMRIDLSRRFATQAWLYVVAFLLSWIWPMAQWVDIQKTGRADTPWFFLTVVFNPLQGFMNAMIYLRPRYLKYRQREAILREQTRRLQQQQKNDSVEVEGSQSIGPGFLSEASQAVRSALLVHDDDDDYEDGLDCEEYPDACTAASSSHNPSNEVDNL